MDDNETNKTVWQIGSAYWISPTLPDGAVNQYVDYLHHFLCEEIPDAATLRISADTDFVLFLNGELIGHGQYATAPDRKTYEQFDVRGALQCGENTIAITQFYNGRTSSVYTRGDAGVVFELRGTDVLAASGTQTLWRQNPCYHSGPIAIVSGQLAYTFGYDARAADDYSPDATWTRIAESEATHPPARLELPPRPIARLVDGGYTSARRVANGTFRRDLSVVEDAFGPIVDAQSPAGCVLKEGVPVSPGWMMQRDTMTASSISFEPDLNSHPSGLKLSADSLGEDDGFYLLFDMGQQEVGHLDLEIDAPAGTLLDIGYGEHIDDGRVRSSVGGRSFAGRYICRDGRQRFTHHFLRWAGRYLSIHVRSATFTLHRLSLERREYPVEHRGEIDTGRALHTRLVDVSRRTLHLCMHEHYEDTPWREQALYANDARTQALCGYYAFGETAMPSSSFALLGHGQRGDGFLYLTAPGQPGITIPSFTLVWMLAVRDHFLYSGDDRLARAFLPQILTMLRAFLDEREKGLLPLRQVKGIWHFYDWSAGMSGYRAEDFEAGLEADAPLNCFLILALEAALQIMDWCGKSGGEDLSAAVVELRQNVADRFWDAEQGVFRTHERAETLTQLTQALAVLAGVGDSEMQDRVLARMARPDTDLAEPGLSQSFYTFQALMTRKQRFGAAVMTKIEKVWSSMLDAGATTFWETIKGASDFSNAGSLCHAWSASPIYVLYHDVLGVRPVTPGFETFAVEPLEALLTEGHARVPVPGGEINLTWKNSDAGVAMQVSAPKHVKKVSSHPSER